MIVFDLRCGEQGHVFEAWFGSSADYEDQRTRGLVVCPVCGSADLTKAPMAPAVPKKGGSGIPADSELTKQRLAQMAAMQKKLLEKSENVGELFADEARAIHLGEADARAIHGRATARQAESLIEDGIPVAPLPFPIAEPGEEN